MSISENIKKIFSILNRKQRFSLIVLFFLMLIGMLLETLGIGLILPVLTLITDPEIVYKYSYIENLYISIGEPSQPKLIIYVLLLLSAFYFFKTLCLAYVTWEQLKLVFGIQVYLSKKLFKTYLKLPFSFHFDKNSSDLIRNITVEVDQFGGAMSAAISLVAECLVLIGILILLFIFQPIATAVLGCVLGISSIVFYKFTKSYVYKWGKARQKHQGKRIQYIQQGLGAIKDIKVLHREDNFINRYSIHNEQNGRVNMLENLMTKLPRLWLELIAVFCLTLLVSVVLYQESIELLVPTLGLFAGAAFRLLPSVNRIVGSLQGLRYTIPSIEVLAKEIEISSYDNTAQSNEEIKFTKHLDLRNLSFSYNKEDNLTLKNINLSIPFGTSVGFVGYSGSGKSTLMDLILGVIEPDEGEIVVDGINVKSSLENWQKQIGYVPQNIYVTDDTLMNNVALGLNEDEIDENAVLKAIKSAQLNEFLETLPEGLNTRMGERGIRLSGGQLQRVGIARALYHDPKIIILDEASSALDSETEKKIMADVNKLKGKKTILIIAHRESTIENCDKVYRVNDGIIENYNKIISS